MEQAFRFDAKQLWKACEANYLQTMGSARGRTKPGKLANVGYSRGDEGLGNEGGRPE